MANPDMAADASPLLGQKAGANQKSAAEPSPRQHAGIFPGTFLTTEEEYGSGANTFADEKGNVYAACTGTADFNEKVREVSITKPGRCAKPLEVGSIVLAQVKSVREQMVGVGLLSASKQGEERKITSSAAFVPVSAISESFIRDARDEFKIGDIIRAKVTKIKPFGIDLTTAGSELGVVRAFCIRCRAQLGMFGKGLKCQACGSNEMRKLASDYGNRIELNLR